MRRPKYRQEWFDKSGTAHVAAILFRWDDGKHYDVMIDDECYASEESELHALDDVVAIVRDLDWSPIKRV